MKKEKTESLEVLCRIAPYKGPDACVEIVEEDQLKLVPPPSMTLNRRGEPYVRHLNASYSNFSKF